MKYPHVIEGRFISRPNRFIAQIEIGGTEETVHVKNTGRCKELLIPGATVYLAVSDNPARKTKYDLIGVEKQRKNKATLPVNIDSQAANDIAEEWLRKHTDALIRREIRYGSSRFDFFIENGKNKAFLEVKGVTLEKNGVALFPDAPTERGVKHIRELAESLKEGYQAYILFVIQMKEVHLLKPNDETHKAFGDALRQAAEDGVQIYAVDCRITKDSATADQFVKIEL
ncbi:MAG: DNA/RNA nuclease SfsA [Clostridia bacterium]|nr:DNA/RNA nuclease SfsA [Clostridia bacterium]